MIVICVITFHKQQTQTTNKAFFFFLPPTMVSPEASLQKETLNQTSNN